MRAKSSSNENIHPYMRGYLFWDKNRYWNHSGLYSEKTREEMNAMVDAMQKHERSLTKVDGKITNQK